jgi:hypothetical protein
MSKVALREVLTIQMRQLDVQQLLILQKELNMEINRRMAEVVDL